MKLTFIRCYCSCVVRNKAILRVRLDKSKFWLNWWNWWCCYYLCHWQFRMRCVVSFASCSSKQNFLCASNQIFCVLCRKYFYCHRLPSGQFHVCVVVVKLSFESIYPIRIYKSRSASRFIETTNFSRFFCVAASQRRRWRGGQKLNPPEYKIGLDAIFHFTAFNTRAQIEKHR